MNIILFEQLQEISHETYLIPRTDHRSKHIIKILKLVPGDTFSMGLVNGYSGRAEVLSAESGDVRFSWRPEHPCSGSYDVNLLVGAVRPICMKRILREAASLGVRNIIVTGTDLSEASYLRASIWNDEKYRGYLIDGAQQAAVTYIPELLLSRRLDDALDEVRGDALVLDPRQDAVRLSEAAASSNSKTLAVGSERGWSDRERSLFAQRGWKPVSLGTRILRTETACAAGTAVLLSAMNLV